VTLLQDGFETSFDLWTDSGTTAQRVSLYNYVTAAWDQKDSATVGTSEVTRNIAVTTGVANYISNGQLKVRISSSLGGSTSYSLSQELISVQVTP
jgi:hypothetical protein